MLIDTAAVPGGGTLRLMRRDREFSIRVDGRELMASRMHGSEEALAELACARIAGRPKPRLLVGGLGMGFTLRAALDRSGPDARVVVAELVPAVIAWNRGPLAALSGHSVADKRVALREADVAKVIRDERAAYDAILLDVDNGPDGLTSEANDRLYSPAGLGEAKAALRPGGVLAVWSAATDRSFARRLHQAGFAAEEISVRARGNRGPRHVIWLAITPAR